MYHPLGKEKLKRVINSHLTLLLKVIKISNCKIKTPQNVLRGVEVGMAFEIKRKRNAAGGNGN
jgi:hypothetical protein